MERWIDEQEELPDALKTVRDLMSQLRTIKNAAKLRELGKLGALLPNETRWTGKFDMVRRFFKIEQHTRNIKNLDSYLPSPSHRRALDSCVKHFNNFSSIAVRLQKKNLKLSEARSVFEHICDDYPSMKHHLGPDSDIVHDKPFENAVSKIMSGLKGQLTSSERTVVSGLLAQGQNLNSADSDDEDLSYFERIEAKRRKLSASTTKYIDCGFISATTCSVERLFSAARLIRTWLRKRMSPLLFE